MPNHGVLPIENDRLLTEDQVRRIEYKLGQRLRAPDALASVLAEDAAAVARAAAAASRRVTHMPVSVPLCILERLRHHAGWYVENMTDPKFSADAAAWRDFQGQLRIGQEG